MASKLRDFIDAARAEGYSDDEVSQHLSSGNRTFGRNTPIKVAVDEGYKLDEILDYHEGKSESFWKDDIGGGLTAAGKMLQRGWEEIKFKNRATGDEFHPRNYLSDEQKEGIREKYMTDPETFGDSGWLLENVLTPEQKAQRDEEIAGDSKMTEYLSESKRLGEEAESARSLAAVNDRWSAAGMAANMVETTARMAPSVAAGVITRSPTVALSLLGTDVFGNELATGREMGLDETTATRRAFLMAGSEVATETVPVLAFLGKLGGKGVGSRILRSAMSESGEEAIATYVQTGLDAGLYEENASLQNAIEKLSSMETLEEAGYAMLLGGGVGATLGTPGAFKSVRDEAKQLNEINKLRDQAGIAEYEAVSKELNALRKQVSGPEYNKLPEEGKQALEKQLLEKEYEWSQVHLKTADAQKEILDLVDASDDMYEKLSWDTAWAKNNEQADRYANARMRAVLDSAPDVESATLSAEEASQKAAPLQAELGTLNSIASGEAVEDPAVYDDLIERKLGRWTSNKKNKFVLNKKGQEHYRQLQTQIDNFKGAAQRQTEEAKVAALKSTGVVTEELTDEDYMDETVTEETYPEVPEQVTDEDYMDEVVTDRAYPEQADVTDQDYPPLPEQEVTDQDYPEPPDYDTPQTYRKAEDLPEEIDYLDSTSRTQVMEGIEEDAKPFNEKRDLTPEGIARRAAWDQLTEDEKFRRAYEDADFPGVQNKRAYNEDNERNPTKVQGFFDIDNLGWANDGMGQKKDQDTGDKYIRKILKAVQNEQKNNPEIELYRYGGDEFMITAPTQASAEKFLANVEKRLSTYKPVVGKNGGTLQPTITTGVARQRTAAMARAGAKKKAKVDRGEAAPKGQAPFTYTPPAGEAAPTVPPSEPRAMRDRGALPDSRAAMQPYELGRRIRELGERLDLFSGETIAEALREADQEKTAAFYAWVDQSTAELIDGIRKLTEMYEGLTESDQALYEDRAGMWRAITNNPELTAQQAFMIERSGYLSNVLSDAEPRTKTHPVRMVPSMRRNAKGETVRSVLDSAFADRIRQIWETQQEGDMAVIPDAVVEDLIASSEKWNDILQKDLTTPADQLINRMARWTQFDSANRSPHPLSPNVAEYKESAEQTAKWDPVFHKGAVSRDQYTTLQAGDEVEVETADGRQVGTVSMVTKSSVVVDWEGGEGVYDPDVGEVRRSARFSKELGHQVTVRGRRRGVSYEGQLGKWPEQAHLGRRIGFSGAMYADLANQELSREYEEFLESADQLTYSWLELERAKAPTEKEMARAASIVDSLLKGYINLPQIKLVRNGSEYPLHLMQQMIGDQAHDVRGMFDGHMVYVDVGSAIEAVKEGMAEDLPMAIAETVMHEVIGHYGIRGFFGNTADLEVWTNRFLTAFPEQAIATALREGMVNVDPELSSLEQRRAANQWLKNEAKREDFLRVGEELIAYAAGRALIKGQTLNAEQRNVLQRFFDWVRNWLVDHGWGRFSEFNERQMMRIIADAQRFVYEGTGWSYYEIIGQHPVRYMRNGDMFQNSWTAEFNATREEVRGRGKGKYGVAVPVYPENATAETYANTLRSRVKTKESALSKGMLESIGAIEFLENLTWGDIYAYAPDSLGKLNKPLVDLITVYNTPDSVERPKVGRGKYTRPVPPLMEFAEKLAEHSGRNSEINTNFSIRTVLSRQVPKDVKIPREALVNFMHEMTPVFIPVDPSLGIDLDITPDVRGQLPVEEDSPKMYAPSVPETNIFTSGGVYRELMLVQTNPDPQRGDESHWGEATDASSTIAHARVGESMLADGSKAYSIIELQHLLQGRKNRAGSVNTQITYETSFQKLTSVVTAHAESVLQNFFSSKSTIAFVNKRNAEDGEWSWADDLASNIRSIYPPAKAAEMMTELLSLDPLDVRAPALARKVDLAYTALEIADAIEMSVADKDFANLKRAQEDWNEIPELSFKPTAQDAKEIAQKIMRSVGHGGPRDIHSALGVFTDADMTRELVGNLYASAEGNPAQADKKIDPPAIGGFSIPVSAINLNNGFYDHVDPVSTLLAEYAPFDALFKDDPHDDMTEYGPAQHWIEYKEGDKNLTIWMSAANQADLDAMADKVKERLASPEVADFFENIIGKINTIKMDSARKGSQGKDVGGRYLYLHSDRQLKNLLSVDWEKVNPGTTIYNAQLKLVNEIRERWEDRLYAQRTDSTDRYYGDIEAEVRIVGRLPTRWDKQSGEPLDYAGVYAVFNKGIVNSTEARTDVYYTFDGQIIDHQLGIEEKEPDIEAVAQSLVSYYEKKGEEPNFDFPIRNNRYRIGNRPSFYARNALPDPVNGSSFVKKMSEAMTPVDVSTPTSIENIQSQLKSLIAADIESHIDLEASDDGSFRRVPRVPVTPVKAQNVQKALINYTLFDAVRRGYKKIVWGGGEYSPYRGMMNEGYTRNSSVLVSSHEYETDLGTRRAWKIVPSQDTNNPITLDDSNLDITVGVDVGKVIRAKASRYQGGGNNYAFDVMSYDVGHPIMVARSRLGAGKSQSLMTLPAMMTEVNPPKLTDMGTRLLRGGRASYDIVLKNTINNMVKDLGGKVKETYLHDTKGMEATMGPSRRIYRNQEVEQLKVEEVYLRTKDPKHLGLYAYFDPQGRLSSTEIWKTETAAERALERFRQRTIKGFQPQVYELEITEEMEEYYSKGGRPLYMRNRRGSSVDAGLEDLAEKYFAVTPTRTLAERMQDWKDNWKLITTMGIFDKLAGIKQALEVTESTLDPYYATRLTTGLDVIMTRTFEAGYPEWRENVVTHQGGQGLFQILAPVQNNLEEWGWYMAARRAEVLMDQKRENLMSAEDIQRFKALEEEFPVFRQVADDYAEFNKKVLDFAEASGIIDPDTRAVWDHHEYVPFYRVQDDRIQGALSPKMGIANQTSPIRRLTGGTDKLGDIVNNITANYTKLIDASLKNHAAQMTVDALQDSGFMGNAVIERASYGVKKELIPMSEVKKVLKNAEVDTDFIPQEVFEGLQKMFAIKSPVGKPGYFQVLRDGKPEMYYADPTDPLTSALFESLSLIDFAAFGKIFNSVLKPARFFKRLLTGAITLDPGFTLRNYLRDMLSARITSGERYEPFTGAARGLMEAFREGEDLQKMMSAGAAFESGYLNYGDPDSTHRAIRRSMRSASFRDSVLDTPIKLFQAYRHGLSAAENASRIAIYRAVKKRGGSDLEAAYQSKDIMDFSMSGSWPLTQFLIQTVPFMNARLQGLYRLGRGFKSYPMSVAGYGALLGIASIAHILMYSDDDQERYDALEDWDKDTYYHFWIPINGEKHHFRLPKPFEIGAIFSTIPERALELIRATEKGDATAYKTFLKSLGHMVSDTFALDPTPQIIKPLLEVKDNKNSFTERDIVTYFEKERRQPAQRYRYYTSPSLIALSELQPDMPDSMWPESIRTPIALEHLWRGYMGTLGNYFMQATDAIYRAASSKPDIPEMSPQDIPVIGGFWRGTSPPRRTKYEQAFYDILRQSLGSEGSINFLDATGRDDQLELLEGKYGPWLDVKDDFVKARQEIREINVEMMNIYSDPKMAPEIKREKLDELQLDKNKEFKDLYELRPGGPDNPIEQALKDQSPSTMLAFNEDEVVRFMSQTDRPTTASLIESIGVMSPKDRETLLR